MSADAMGIAGLICFALYIAGHTIIGEMRRQGEATRNMLQAMIFRLDSIDKRGHKDEMDR